MRAVPVLLALAALPAASLADPLPRPGDWVLRGDLKVVSVTPSNPAGKDRFRTRIDARLETTGGRTWMDMRPYRSAEHCRFEVVARPGGPELSVREPCAFRALGSPGTLRVVRSRVVQSGDRLRVDATLAVRWLAWTATIDVSVAGGRARP